MFDVHLKAETLREFVTVVSTLVDEVKLKVKKDSVQVRAVDPAHVAMVDLKLKAAAFDKYTVSDCELGIDIERLKDVLKLAKAGDTVELRHDDDRNRLVIKIGKITRTMSLVDTAGMTDPKGPNLTLPANVQVRTEHLLQGIRASESVSDHIALRAQKDSFELRSEGDTDTANLELPKAELEHLEVSEEVTSLFSLDYFANMIKSVGSAETVTLKLGKNYPVMISFQFAQSEGAVTYLLAPRIENE